MQLWPQMGSDTLRLQDKLFLSCNPHPQDSALENSFALGCLHIFFSLNLHSSSNNNILEPLITRKQAVVMVDSNLM